MLLILIDRLFTIRHYLVVVEGGSDGVLDSAMPSSSFQTVSLIWDGCQFPGKYAFGNSANQRQDIPDETPTTAVE